MVLSLLTHTDLPAVCPSRVRLHSRVAMLAALGYPLAEVFHPLFGGAIDTPSFTAFQQTPLQTFWPAVVFFIAGFGAYVPRLSPFPVAAVQRNGKRKK